MQPNTWQKLEEMFEPPLMNTMSRLLLLLIVANLFGCVPQPPPIPREVPGTYRGQYDGGTETFEIRSDGSFTQVLTVGTTNLYTNSGTWRIKGKQVVFDGVFSMGPGPGTVKARHPWHKTDNLAGLWVSGDKGSRGIWFNVDVGYGISKVVQKPGQNAP